MGGEIAAAPTFEHTLAEIFNSNFITNLTDTQNLAKKYHESYVTTTAKMLSTTLPPDTDLIRLSETFFMIATNNSDFNPNRTSAENDGVRLEHAPRLSKTTMVKVYVLGIMAILSFFGNLLTMWNIYKTRIRRSSSRHTWSAIYSLIFHLSIADLLVTGFCIVGEAAWFYTVQWIAGEIACKLVKLFQMFSLYLSTYIMVLIGVDRWIAVKYPMKSLNRSKRSYRLIGGTYVISLILSLPQLFIFHLARGPFVEEFHQCVTHGFYTARWQEQLYTTFTLIFTFLLPLCILFLTYVSTFCTISSSEKMFMAPKQPTNSGVNAMQANRTRLIHKAKMKSLRISVVIIIAFIICWTPYYAMMITLMFLNPDKRLTEGLVSAIFVFGMSNSLVNPVIYGAFHLRPMKRKASQINGNANSFNRIDSQRTHSLTTALTQLDSNGRRTSRQTSYLRAPSSRSNSKEHVSLLQMPAKSAIMHKFNSERSSRFSSYQHTQGTQVTCNEIDDADSGASDDTKQNANSSLSTVVYGNNSPNATKARPQNSESPELFSNHCKHSAPSAPASVSFLESISSV
ncbi:gonadotropin-releasing hormone receptor [Eurosta solidaginis]|uniref:gonadotropin-releasing hormone receptor n=1 Tax=Eurosta solidaginis TaxID=178769 RepID=UPI0035314F62